MDQIIVIVNHYITCIFHIENETTQITTKLTYNQLNQHKNFK